jgi:hypothetical protein
MEALQSRQTTQIISAVQAPTSDRVHAPKDFFLGPVFAATPQSGQREVIVGNRHYLLGGFKPLDPDARPPALDVRHARAIFTLLFFRSEYGDNPRVIRFAFNDFCRRYANSNGGRYSRAIKKIISELMESYIQVTDMRSKLATSYRLIERVVIPGRAIGRRDSSEASSRQTELRLNEIWLSPEFYSLLNRIAELQDLKLSVFTSIRSPLAQAIYLYIPSRSVHHDESNPFEISMRTLLEQVSFPIPVFKSKRKELFTKHQEEGRSILQQLDGRETLTGRFRVELAETADGSDWKLRTWVEKTPKAHRLINSDSKIIRAYLASGRPPEYLEQALANIAPLTDYQIELLQAGKIEIEKNRKFLEWAKAVLKDAKFNELLSGAKADELEGRIATKNPTARLIHRIMAAVGAPAALPKGGLARN